MPTFGQYQTAQRLFQTGVGGLYALQGDDKKVIKVLQPPAGIWSEEHVREEIDGFLLRAKTQKALAKSSQNWAAVHETGTIREEGSDDAGGGGAQATGEVGGAYAVLDRHERSVQSLIDGRVNLTNDDLRNIMAGVLRGLIDIGKLSQRPHGNLKASNILLLNSTDLATATVHLSDPAADGAILPATGAKDLADFARILYELVNHRRFEGGTIGKSKDWDELGPNGEDWRKLCGAFLDTGAPAEERDLEKVLANVLTWTAKPKKKKGPMLALAMALIVILVGVPAVYLLTRPKKLDFNEQTWERLCMGYESWFGNFADQMADESVRKKFASPPYPTEVAKLFNDEAKEVAGFAPAKIAKQPSSNKELAANPTDAAKTGYGPNESEKGIELIDSVSKALSPEQWTLLGTMSKTAQTYEERGWQKPAAGIRAIIEGAKPPAVPMTSAPISERWDQLQRADVFGNVDRTITASKSVTDIEARWGRIQDELKKLPGGDALKVPLLAALPKFAEDLPRSQADPNKPGTLEDVTSLAASFTAIEKLVGQLVTDLAPPGGGGGREIVYSELAKDPAAQVPANGQVTVEMFAALPAVARGYLKIADDPRGTVDWAKSLAEIQSQAIDVISEANRQDKNLPALVAGRGNIQRQVDEWKQIAPVEKNRQQLVSLVSKAKSDLDTLQSDANNWVAPYIIDPAKYIAQQNARLTSSPVSKTTPVVYAAWQAKHKALLAKVDPKALKNYKTYQDFNDKFDGMEKAFLGFETLIPAAVPGLSAVTGNDWKHAIAAEVATVYRENALKDVIAKLPWNEDRPELQDAGFVSYRTQRLADFEKNRTDALALINDYSTITDRLDKLYLQPNEPAGGGKSWRDLYTAWQQSKNPLLSDNVIVAAVKPIADRVAALLAVDTVGDYKTLLADTGSPAPEIALTAWRKMGTAAVSEDVPVLDDEDKTEAALSAKLADLNKANKIDNAHLQALNNEIAAQRPIRWRQWADTITAPAAVQTALDRMASFKVTLSPQTDATMIYNQAFYGLKKDYERGLKEAELKPIAQKFIDGVNAMPAAVAQNKDVQDLLTRMGKSLVQSQDDSSTAGAGPKLAGWEQDNSKDGIRLFYFPGKANAKYTLEFVRQQVNNKTVFLCTTEMSFGLFADTINASTKFSDIDNAGKPANKAHWFKTADDPWLGPRVWRITGKKFVLNNDGAGKPLWLFKVPQMGDNPYYPENAAPPPPSNEQPMQYLSPWSAMYVARMLGCRLPTSEEWQAAYDRFEATNSAAPKDAWNLRGAAWKLQQDYAVKMAGNGMKFPDDGMFLTTDKLFDPITAKDAKPWIAANIAKVAPARVTATNEAYKGSVMWFRNVGTQPGVAPASSGTGGMHDLVGNVAEYAFDGTADKPANGVIKDINASVADIDAAIAGAKKAIFVIGGSSLSPPELDFNKKLPVDPDLAQTTTGFSDVGVRLAYTAPIDSIVDVLSSAFKEPKYLPVRSNR